MGSSMSIFGRVLLGVVVAWTVGCAGAASLSLGELNAVATEIKIQDRTYALKGYIWRDFMPVSPAGGRPMQAVITLVDVNGLDIPAAVGMERLWVVSGAEVWETGFSDEPRYGSSADRMEKIARDGPMWEPGTAVDAVVRLTANGGQKYLLRASHLTVERTN